jgi:hypothetical protein
MIREEYLQELAEYLHYDYCMFHPMECSFEYGNWTDKKDFPGRVEWMKRAIELDAYLTKKEKENGTRD